MALVKFTSLIEKFGKQGEKTGWTYFSIPFDIAEKINPGNRKSYRVKGLLDKVPIEGISILPMGEGNYIMPLKADIRKLLKKQQGDMVIAQLEIDTHEYQLNEEMMICMQDDKQAFSNFSKLPKSHQNYYSKYIESAKTASTQAKRIAQVVNAMHYNWTYAEMLKKERELKF